MRRGWLRTLRSIKMSSCLAAAMLTTSSFEANSFMRLKMYMSLFSRMPSSVTIVLNMLSTLYRPSVSEGHCVRDIDHAP